MPMATGIPVPTSPMEEEAMASVARTAMEAQVTPNKDDKRAIMLAAIEVLGLSGDLLEINEVESDCDNNGREKCPYMCNELDAPIADHEHEALIDGLPAREFS